MIPGLLVTEGAKRGFYIEFAEEQPFWMGRSVKANFVIEEPMISNLHCCLVRKDSQLMLQDNSTNGTRLNGQKLHKSSILLKNTDIFCVGSFHFQVVNLDKNAVTDFLVEEDDSPPPSPEKQRSIGPYRLVEMIGSGAVGEVYKAIHQETKQLVALKIFTEHDLEPEFAERSLREGKLLAQLNHPFIIRLYETNQVDTEAGRCTFLALEYFQGVDLNNSVQVQGKFSWQKALNVLYQMSLALEYMHQQGILHRDLKPQNVLYNEIQGIAKIIDFGFGKCILDTEQRDAIFRTKTGSSLGTPDFMPIEQWHDLKDVHKQSDIYSLGATIYFLLTGIPPHGKYEDILGLYRAVFQQKIIPIENHLKEKIPADFQKLLKKMISFQAKDRPESIQEVLKQIKAIASQHHLSLKE